MSRSNRSSVTVNSSFIDSQSSIASSSRRPPSRFKPRTIPCCFRTRCFARRLVALQLAARCRTLESPAGAALGQSRRFEHALGVAACPSQRTRRPTPRHSRVGPKPVASRCNYSVSERHLHACKHSAPHKHTGRRRLAPPDDEQLKMLGQRTVNSKFAL